MWQRGLVELYGTSLTEPVGGCGGLTWPKGCRQRLKCFPLVRLRRSLSWGHVHRSSHKQSVCSSPYLILSLILWSDLALKAIHPVSVSTGAEHCFKLIAVKSSRKLWRCISSFLCVCMCVCERIRAYRQMTGPLRLSSQTWPTYLHIITMPLLRVFAGI